MGMAMWRGQSIMSTSEAHLASLDWGAFSTENMTVME
jgi:hypothetical protein